MATVNGTVGNDFIHLKNDGLVPPTRTYKDIPKATPGVDFIDSGGSGREIIHAGGGDDHILFDDFVFEQAATDMDPLDRIDGGAGHDTLYFRNPDLTLRATSLLSIEALFITFDNFGARLTLNDANVAAGERMVVIFNSDLNNFFGEVFFDGSAETDGALFISAGHSTGLTEYTSNTLIGGALGDVLAGCTLSDFVSGGGGDDTIEVSLIDFDTVSGGGVFDGGAGFDTLVSFGDDVPSFAFNSIEKMIVLRDYLPVVSRSLDDTHIAAGEHLIVDASALATASFLFDDRGELDGSLTVIAADGNDTVATGAQGDTLSGFGGDDELRGGKGGDRLVGGDGGDHLIGGNDNDTLNGGDGDDTVIGGNGNDRTTGGAGFDIFVFLTVAEAKGKRDVITDFKTSEGDQIDLSGTFAGTLDFIGKAAFSGTAGEVRYSGKDKLTVEVNVDTDLRAEFAFTLSHVPSLAATDFIL